MLHVSYPVRCTARRLASISTSIPCAACKCRCGRQLARDGVNTTGRRPYASPPTRPAQNTYARAQEAKRRKEGLKGARENRHYNSFQNLKDKGGLFCDVDVMVDFLTAFKDLAARNSDKSGIAIRRDAFAKLLELTGVPMADCFAVGRLLLLDEQDVFRRLGKKLIYSCSNNGHGFATMLIMEEALVAAKDNPKILHRADLAPVRQHLTQMATNQTPYSPAANQQFIPMVCAGRVAVMLGEIDDAIRIWTAAMPGAMEYAHMDPSVEFTGDHPVLRANLAPWNELSSLYHVQGESEKAKQVALIGCQQDDPFSHYSVALLEKRIDERDNRPVYKSAWLYHMTKAAGAGYVKATHALGIFYAVTEWKYIEDEPPDRIKPTPFDSYPPQKDHGRIEIPFWHRLAMSFGIRKQETVISETDSLFLTASFPSTPYDRWKMAMHWLEASMGLLYAPSFLAATQLLLEKELYEQAAAPAEALNLSDERYEYASQDDFYKGRRIAGSARHNAQGDKKIPNPGYNPEKAKTLVREVFYAVRAQHYARYQLALRRSSRFVGLNPVNLPDKEVFLDEMYMGSGVSTNVSKWFRFPETREMYTYDEEFILWDDEMKVNLEEQARRICDEQHWDIFDEQGGLVYRHGLGSKVSVPSNWLYKGPSR